MCTKSVLRGALALLVLGLSAVSTHAVTLRVYQTRANADVQAGPSGFDSQVGDTAASAQFDYGSGAFSASAISAVDISTGHLGGYASNTTAYGASSTGSFLIDFYVENPDPSVSFTVAFAVNGTVTGSNSSADFRLSYGSDPANARHILCFEGLGCLGNSTPITFSDTSARLSAQLLLTAVSGVVDFMHSADIRIIAPAGVTVIDTTGLVQVVPEPSIAGLLACGLAVLGLSVRGRKADRQS